MKIAIAPDLGKFPRSGCHLTDVSPPTLIGNEAWLGLDVSECSVLIAWDPWLNHECRAGQGALIRGWIDASNRILTSKQPGYRRVIG